MSSTIPLSDIDTSEVRLVTSILMVIFFFTTATVLLRFFAKWKLEVPFSREDWLILGASILAAGPLWMFVESAFTQELGRHVEINGLNAQIDFRKKLYFGELVSMFAIISTQLSILAFYLRIFGPFQMMQVLIRVTAGVVVCGRIGFFITSIFQCNPIHKVWDIDAEGTCINTHVFFLFNTAFNIITNFGLLVLPLPAIWKLQMKRPKKVELCCLLTLGGLIIVISGLRLRSLLHLNLTSADVTWKMVFPVTWSCVEPQAGIFCACLPFLRKLLTKFFQMFLPTVDASFSTGQHSRQSICSQELVPGHGSLEKLEGRGQKTYTTRAWAERGHSVDEEKPPQEFDEGKWSQEVDEGKRSQEPDEGNWPNGIMVTKVFELVSNERPWSGKLEGGSAVFQV